MHSLMNKCKRILGLSFELARTNFKLRNEGSYLGVLWYILDPLLLFFILIFLREVILESNIEYYPVYLIIGLILFNFFRKVTINACTAISSNSSFIKSMVLPTESFVISKTLEFTFAHFFEVIILLCLMIYYDLNYFLLLTYPLFFIIYVIFILGVSFILASLGVFINDLRNIWMVVTRLLWFLTPIFYLINDFGRVYIINSFNPLHYFIDLQREILIYNRMPSPGIILIILLFSFSFFLLGIIIFEYNKNKFVEKI